MPRRFSGPLLPGTTSVRQVNRRNPRYRKAKPTKSLTRMVKKISLNQCETKKSNQYSENVQLFHNVTNFKENLLATTQGAKDPEGFANQTANRIGDEVLARGINMKFWFSNKNNRPNVMYHVYVFRYNTTLTVASGLNDAYFWRGQDGNGSSMNRMVDAPNRDRVQVLKKFSINSTYNYSDSYEKSYFKELWIPLKDKKILYRKENDTLPQYTTLGVAIVPYDAFGTGTTDNIASYAWSSTFYYKDP